MWRRSAILNASEVPFVMGFSPFCHRETTCVTGGGKPWWQTKSLQRGARLEAPLVKMYQKRAQREPWHNRQQKARLKTSASLPIKGIADLLYPDRIVELKSSSRTPRKVYNSHYLQAEAYMEIYDRPVAHVAYFNHKRGELKIFEIKRSDILRKHASLLRKAALQIAHHDTLAPLSDSTREKISLDLKENCLKNHRVLHSQRLLHPLRV